jgi:hypothetical protein
MGLIPTALIRAYVVSMYIVSIIVSNFVYIYVERTATHCRAHCNIAVRTATHCHTLRSTYGPAHCGTQPRALPHTAALLHTAALQHTHCRTAAHCRALPRTTAHCRTLSHTAAHCRTPRQPHTAVHIAINQQDNCRTLPRALRAHHPAHCHTLPLAPLALPHCRALPHKFYRFI